MPEHCIPLHVCEHANKMQPVSTQGAKHALVPHMQRNRSSIVMLAIVSLLMSLLAYKAGIHMAWKDAITPFVQCWRMHGLMVHNV